MRRQYQIQLLGISFILFLLLLINCSTERDNILEPENGDIINEATEITGMIDGTLSLSDSPFHVTGNLAVDSAKSLIIEPGVKLLFDDSTMLLVRGRLTANGTADRVITFSAYDTKWKGVKIINSSLNSIMSFCIIEKVNIDYQDSSAFGAVEINESSATIRNCIFRDNQSMQGGGLSLLGDDALITNNIFRENSSVAFGGAIVAVESSSKLINNTIYNNNSFNVGGGLVVFNPVDMEAQNNIFFENSSTSGDPRITFEVGDSSKFKEAYNFLWMGDMNPKFISSEDFHLQNSSPAIDAGNPDQTYNDTDGSRNDQGAYGGPWGNW